MAAPSISRPAGTPSTMIVRPGPWDSPAVSQRISSRSRNSAARITSTGASRPVQMRNDEAACCSSIGRPSTTVAPAARARRASGVGTGGRDEIHDDQLGTQRGPRKRILAMQSQGRRVDDHVDAAQVPRGFPTRSPAAHGRPDARASARGLRARSAVRFVIETVAPAFEQHRHDRASRAARPEEQDVRAVQREVAGRV